MGLPCDEGFLSNVSMTSPPVVQYASRTDVGMRRAANQDSQVVRLCTDLDEWSRCGHLFLVADGMGGHAVGDLASRIAVETLPHAYFKQEADTIEQRLRNSITAANKAINDRGRENPEFEGMGTTCSVLSLSERGAVVGHVGDSRIYRVRQGHTEQLTFDHSLQWEMIRLGRATAENVELFHPRNVITRCLGPDPNVQIDLEGPFSVEVGDVFVLCSDGLTNHVSDSEIGQIVASLPASESSRLLINLANCRGGSDNCTVIVVQIESYPAAGNALQQSGVTTEPDRTIPATTAVSAKSRGVSLTFLFRMASALCLLSGVGLIWYSRTPAGVVLILAAAFAWILSLRATRRSSASAEPEPRLSGPQDAGEFSLSESVVAAGESSSLRTSFRKSSPYRVVESGLSDGLLSHLAEVQSELVQAARDSGWKVDFEELTNLNRQAVLSQQGSKFDRALKTRSKAIDLLMRELYQRARSS